MKEKLFTIIFEAETKAGKLFDVALIATIIASVLVVLLDSVASLRLEYSSLFYFLEWIFTILFSIEYGLRIWITRKPSKYIFSFFGLIDLFSILPTIISLFIPGTQYFLVIRLLRVLRVFRVLKLVRMVQESTVLISSLKSSLRKISVFIFTILILVIILGTIIYTVEGEANGFSNIPISIYWAIVTLTTVGYGDIAPQTHLGQFIAAAIMLLGYGIIAVPAGIVSTELAQIYTKNTSTRSCPNCTKEGQAVDAIFCKYCGGKMDNV